MADGVQSQVAPQVDGRAEETEEDLPYALPLDLVVKDREAIAALLDYPDGPARVDFALTALNIGIAALKHANGRLDADLIQRESSRMLSTLQSQLDQHSQHIQQRLTGELKNYFDPESGRFNERVHRLVKQDGELEQLLRGQIGGEDSQLVRTLLSHVGQDSPLMKLLSPDESQGLLGALRESVDAQLKFQRDRLLEQFSLDNKQSALARLVDEMTQRHGKLRDELEGKIDEVVKEFSLDEDNSALSRLVKNVDAAQKTISAEFSLDNEQSAFSRLNAMLKDTQGAIDKNLTLDQEDSPLARLKRELLTILKDHTEGNQKFQEEVKVALGKIIAKREEAQRSTRHGVDFEDAVHQFLVGEAQRVGDVAQHTGNTVGLIKNCKVGDSLIELGPDSPAPGVRIAVEAKEDASYTVARSREEIKKARDNRGAQLGLFVFSQKSAPEGIDPLYRYGDDILLVWDADDPQTDVFLRAALTMARCLCIRQSHATEAQAADFEAMQAALLEIQKRTGQLDEITKSAEGIQSHSDKILNRARIIRRALEKQVETLQDRINDLRESVDGAQATD